MELTNLFEEHLVNLLHLMANYIFKNTLIIIVECSPVNSFGVNLIYTGLYPPLLLQNLNNCSVKPYATPNHYIY